MWILTTDKLPEEGQRVLAVVKDSHFINPDYDLLRYCPKENYWEHDYGSGFCIDDSRCKVLAWLPIPEYTE